MSSVSLAGGESDGDVEAAPQGLLFIGAAADFGFAAAVGFGFFTSAALRSSSLCTCSLLHSWSRALISCRSRDPISPTFNISVIMFDILTSSLSRTSRSYTARPWPSQEAGSTTAYNSPVPLSHAKPILPTLCTPWRGIPSHFFASCCSSSRFVGFFGLVPVFLF